jgi:hypothetical protein
MEKSPLNFQSEIFGPVPDDSRSVYMSNIQSPVVKLKDAARTSRLARNLHNQTHSKRTTDLSFPKNKRGELPAHNIDQTLVEGKESRQDLKEGRQWPSPTRHFWMERIPEHVPMEGFPYPKSSTDMIIDTFRHEGETKGLASALEIEERLLN